MARRGSFTLDIPGNLGGALGYGLNLLTIITGALPYDLDGIARIGVRNDPKEPVLPSLLDLRQRGIGEPRGVYHGSEIITELLGSTPRILAYNGNQLVGQCDWPPGPGKLDEPIGDILRVHGDEPYVDYLVMAYATAIHNLGRPEAGRIPREDLGAMLHNLSPTLGGPCSEREDLLGLTVRCLQLVRAMLMLCSPRHELVAGGHDRLLAFSRLLGKDLVEAGLDESLRIDATILEMLAEVIEVKPRLSQVLGFIYPAGLRSDAAETWTAYLEEHNDCGEFDRIYRRALNIAHQEPDYALIERLFRLNLTRNGSFLHHVQFNVRTAWAVLHNHPARRSEPEMWDDFCHHISVARKLLACWGDKGALQMEDIAGKVLEHAEDEARSHAPGWQHLN